MRFGKLFLTIISLLLAGLALFGEHLVEDDSLTVSVVSPTGETEIISPWVNHYNGEAYFFLPGYADLSTARVRMGKDGSYLLDGEPVRDGMACDSFLLNTAYAISVDAQEKAFARTLTFVRSGGVGSVFLDTKSGSMESVFQNKEYEERCHVRAYTAEGVLDLNRADVWVKGRGNSTWENPKKPLNLEFYQDTAFLGMEPASNWALLANYLDSSNLKNKIVLDFAQQIAMPYSPDSRWVDLYLNGEYTGLYLLCEKNEVHPNRVNLTGEGSFLVAKDGEWRFEEANKPYIMTQERAALRIYHADMNSQALQNQWQSAENAILAENGIDPVTGKHFTELIDLESWVLKYLVEETFGTIDGISLSQFFYYDGAEENARIHAGPVWDYDLTMMGMGKDPEDPATLMYCNIPGIYGSPWYPALYEKEAFYNSLREAYATVVRPQLAKIIESGIDDYVRQIELAAAANDIRWSQQHSSAVEYIRDYLECRMAFLDEIWVENVPHYFVTVYGYNGDFMRDVVSPGDPMPQLPEYENDASVQIHGWFYQDTDEPVDFQRPITQDTVVYPKYDVLEQENGETPLEEPHEEPIGTLRIMPLLLALCILLLMMLVEIHQLYGRALRPRTEDKQSAAKQM